MQHVAPSVFHTGSEQIAGNSTSSSDVESLLAYYSIDHSARLFSRVERAFARAFETTMLVWMEKVGRRYRSPIFERQSGPGNYHHDNGMI